MAEIKNNIAAFDKSYSKDKSPTYKLYVEISYHSLKQAILDTSSNTFIGFIEHTFNDVSNDFSLSKQLADYINASDTFNQDYKSILIAIVNNRSTLVPNGIYKAQSLESYHQFNFTIQEDDQFYSDKLINLSAHNVYSIQKSITSIFKNHKNVSFKHFSSGLIEASLMEAKMNKALSSICVNVFKNSFQLVVIKNQKLELYNSFNYQSSEDFIYYLLFVLDQMNINNEEATINLTGDIEKIAPIYTHLYKYIHTLNFVPFSGNLKLSYIFEDIPKHFNYGLFNLYLCE